MIKLPLSDSVLAGEDREKIMAQVRRKFSGALANDTKWNELISYMRSLDGWQPSYRSKWVNGHVSGWDVEWFYHLPFPFVGVEWFDIGLHEHVHRGRLLAPSIVDHSPEILAKLKDIGFEFETRDDVVRIWGYHPKSYEDFPPGTEG